MVEEKYWIFHGSAVSRNRKAIIILGNAGSGKSSLCLAAGLGGAKIISDEPILINKKTFSVTPFRYLIKIQYFFKNFSNWKFSSHVDLNQYSLVKKGKFNFKLFTKEDLSKLDIEVEDREVPLKTIIFLEERKYAPIIHLTSHGFNRGKDLIGYFTFLNKLTSGKRIKFLPKIKHILKNRMSAKDCLNKIIYA